ncbi:MAG: imidazolonepropionase [Flavobacteriales bacterium]
MKQLIKNIGGLVGFYESHPGLLKGEMMKRVSLMNHAWLAVEDGIIADAGLMADWPGISDWRDLEVIDAEGGWVIPSYVDSHTHIVYPASRAGEFSDRIKGMTYEEIAARGGGILNSAAKLIEISEDELYESAFQRLNEIALQGTGAVEIKSGYGLTLEGELKMLRVIKRLKENHPLTIKSTFLGAHAYPADYKQRKAEYMNLIIDEMLPRVVEEGLADYIDAFCESDYFSVEDTERLMEAGNRFGLSAKIHVNQFTSIGGVEACVEANAKSVDHLEVLTEEDIEALKSGNTLPVALPGCSLFIRIPYTPGRKIIDAGLPLVLATDYNPGSCPSGNMNLVMSLACIHMGMTPEEALNASTVNAAFAMDAEQTHGTLTVGSEANFLMTQPMKELADLPYYFGRDSIRGNYIKGRKFVV